MAFYISAGFIFADFILDGQAFTLH